MRSPSTPISLEIAPVRAGPGEEHHGLVVAADGLVDDLPRVLAQPGGLQAGAAGLGVGVGVAGSTSSRMKSSMKDSARPEAV